MRRMTLRSGSAGTPNSRGRCAKSRDVSAYQRAIQREGFAATALQAERDLDVPAGNFLFEQPAQLHLERVGSRRQTKMQIEKTVVHRFQREREGEMSVALGRGRNAGRRTGASFGLAL